jgi:hypothetical protein
LFVKLQQSPAPIEEVLAPIGAMNLRPWLPETRTRTILAKIKQPQFMKHLIHLPVVFFIFLGTSALCQLTPKQFLGTWKTTRTDAKSYSVTEETWVFESLSKGKWTRKLIMSEGAITCNIDNPFTWKISSSKIVEIKLGKTNCNCVAAKKKFEEGLDEFIKNYKASYNNEYFNYKIKTVDSRTINLDDFTLTKQ